MTTHFTKFETNEKKEPKLFFASQFLDASTHLYRRLCPSVCQSVRRSVHPSLLFLPKMWSNFLYWLAQRTLRILLCIQPRFNRPLPIFWGTRHIITKFKEFKEMLRFLYPNKIEYSNHQYKSWGLQLGWVFVVSRILIGRCGSNYHRSGASLLQKHVDYMFTNKLLFYQKNQNYSLRWLWINGQLRGSFIPQNMKRTQWQSIDYHTRWYH